MGTLTHKVTLGGDEAGNITRIDNAIEKIDRNIEAAKQSLEDTRRQIENAKFEAAKPFDKEDELKQKTMRLSELDKELNMDKTDEPQLCDEEALPKTKSERSDRDR